MLTFLEYTRIKMFIIVGQCLSTVIRLFSDVTLVSDEDTNWRHTMISYQHTSIF